MTSFKEGAWFVQHAGSKTRQATVETGHFNQIPTSFDSVHIYAFSGKLSRSLAHSLSRMCPAHARAGLKSVVRSRTRNLWPVWDSPGRSSL